MPVVVIKFIPPARAELLAELHAGAGLLVAPAPWGWGAASCARIAANRMVTRTETTQAGPVEAAHGTVAIVGALGDELMVALAAIGVASTRAALAPPPAADLLVIDGDGAAVAQAVALGRPVIAAVDAGDIEASLRLARLGAADVVASDSGQLRTEQVLALGGQLMPMALSPDGTRLYVARRSAPVAVVTLAVDARAGCAEVLSEAALPASMAHLVTDNTGRWLLSASYGADLVAVQAIAADGVVAAGRGATTYATGRHAHSSLVSPGNRFVLAASLGGGQLHR